MKHLCSLVMLERFVVIVVMVMVIVMMVDVIDINVIVMMVVFDSDGGCDGEVG